MPEESDYGDYDIRWKLPSGSVTSYKLERRCKLGGATCGVAGWHEIEPTGGPLSRIFEARGDIADKYQYRVKGCNVDACANSWATTAWIDVHNLEGVAPAVSLTSATSPGSIEYDASVTYQGDAAVSVPVEVAPGVNGLMPNVGIHYSGARYRERNNEVLPEDILGYGWRISGMSAIRRCVKNRPAEDSIELDTTDSICLDGEPLVLVSGAHWQAGATYRTLRDSFRLIELKVLNGKTWFQVSEPSGEVKEYGKTADSRLKAGSSVHFGWTLNRVEDSFGNEINYLYHRDTVEGINYPLEITYGNNADAKIEFLYGTRNDAPPQPLSHGEIEQEQLVLLHHIKVSLDGNLQREYRLITEPDTEEYRRLKYVQLCGYGEFGQSSECLEPLSIGWLDPDGENPIDIKTGVGEVTDGLGKTTQFHHAMMREGSVDGLFSERPFGEGVVPPGVKLLDPVNGEYRCVVTEVHRSNGFADGWHVTRYSYQGTGLVSENHWGFLGYYAQKIADAETGVVTYKQFRSDFPYIGKVARIEQYEGNYDDNLQRLTAQQFHYQSLSLDVVGGSTLYPFVKQKLQVQLENNEVIGYVAEETDLTTELISGYGELIDGEVHTKVYAQDAQVSAPGSTWGDVSVTSFSEVERTTESVFTLDNRVSPWIVGFVSGKAVNHYDGASDLAPDRSQIVTAIPYQGSNKVGAVTRFPEDPDLELSTTYTYDGYGNVLTETTFGVNVDTRTASASGYIDARYPSQLTNALEQPMTVTYDKRFGAPKKITNANSKLTETTYDEFGREISRKNIDGVEFTTSYSVCYSSTCPVYNNVITAYKVTTSSPVTPLSERYFDILGRPVQLDVESFDGTKVSRKEYNYDEAGRLYLETEPYYENETKPISIYKYDIRNRIESIQKAAGGEVRATYSPLSSEGKVKVTVEEDVYDHGGSFVETQKKVSHYNVAGDLVETIDAFGTVDQVSTVYEHDGMGLLESVVINGDPATESTFDYDAAGNRTFLSDPNLGTVTTTYTALNEVWNQIDGKLQEIDYRYDKLGRIVEKTNSDGVAHWNYDPEGAIGQLANTVYTEDGVEIFRESYFYIDSKVDYKTTALVAGGLSKSYRHDYDYDGLGRLQYITYPSGVEAHYQYNSAGYLEAITDGSSTLKSIVDTTAGGHSIAETYGNGVATSRVYDPMTGQLESIATLGASTIQDNTYEWRTNGTLESRVSSVGAVKREEFTYDSINRLKTSDTRVDGSLIRSLSNEYDKLGNILSKTSTNSEYASVSGYQYGQGGNAGRNAVSYVSVNGEGYNLHYDNNGAITRYDAVSGDDKWITWNGRHLPTEITVGSSKSTETPTARDRFKYGPSGQRFYRESAWWDEASQSMQSEKVFIVGGYEDVLPANDPDYQRIQKVQIEKNIQHVALTDIAGISFGTFEYIHRDHLGSIEKVTDETGNIILDSSFDAFGSRRDTSWQSEISASDLESVLTAQGLTTKRGFTGHEHLDRTGLIHMNGRLYDPTLGRFLSPDPFVQAPANSQSWNRYSYVFNSPLNFTDPSGFIGIRQKFHDSTGGGSSDGWDVYVVGNRLGSGFKETTWNDVIREYGNYYDNRRTPGEEIAIASSTDGEDETIDEVVCNADPETGECAQEDPQFNSNDPNYHEYELRTQICHTMTTSCTAQNVYSALKRFPAPGYDGTSSVENGQVANVPGLGHVTHIVNDDRMSVVNVTMGDHLLYPGKVVRSVVVEGPKIYVNTYGDGTGPLGTMNEILDNVVWEPVDWKIRNAIYNE
ncbi:RHS repeat-associated core domain-containing protein [Microbulbifer celer]|uniref:RHS repeat-associated core domain-containing protein n=1 Tax=Microbulbifer celer TaxID=435905 RepID=A0ABW3U8A3_9GAMM|nr:RHS repeat-associated core domain-containing protein [Microbulbifer celer]UFN57617.1 hypothetical protein LPW13_00805 [Microbulbifer celer]